MIFRTMTFRFATSKGKAYKGTPTESILSLRSTTVAGNQTKCSAIRFCLDSLNNRWVPSNTDFQANPNHIL